MKRLVFLILLFISCNLLMNEDALASTVKWGNYTINSGQIGIVKFSTDVNLYKQNPNGSTSVIIGKKGQAYRVYDIEKIRKYDNLKLNKIAEATKYYLGGGVTVQGNEIIKFEQLPQKIYEQAIAVYGYPVKSLVPPQSTLFGFDYNYNQSMDGVSFMYYDDKSNSFKGCHGMYSGDLVNEYCAGGEAEIKFSETKSAFSYELNVSEQVTKVQIQYPLKKGSIVTITRPNGTVEKEKITKFIPFEFYENVPNIGMKGSFYEYTHVIVTEKGRKFAVGRYMSVTAVTQAEFIRNY
ncbi:hypothetical protein M3649_02305 [Ureibacillus chungkukjangi]|uniref:hypothetical protein n=1 Tax=Ureibacillus chungkukjangi TaxID=1202712 RepID=UPI00203CBE9C|nr:hypothetical protein [Ureibacillus chungkukjangi]MCM3386961.1 hypothetical protein [Ureibacillus chungkukjangi]